MEFAAKSHWTTSNNQHSGAQVLRPPCQTQLWSYINTSLCPTGTYTVSNRIPSNSAKPSTHSSGTGHERVPTKHADHILSNHPPTTKNGEEHGTLHLFLPFLQQYFPNKSIGSRFLLALSPLRRPFRHLHIMLGKLFSPHMNPGSGPNLWPMAFWPLVFTQGINTSKKPALGLST